MKIILERGGVKRELEGPFHLCASRRDLTALRDQIDYALTGDFSYGWLSIWPQPKLLKDTPPRTWED